MLLVKFLLLALLIHFLSFIHPPYCDHVTYRLLIGLPSYQLLAKADVTSWHRKYIKVIYTAKRRQAPLLACERRGHPSEIWLCGCLGLAG